MLLRMWRIVAILVQIVFIDVTLGQDTKAELQGNNVCTATISFTKIQKVPISGIQTIVTRYVTKCGLGLLQCSRYRTIYVPAYRELSTIEYRVAKVCCAGYQEARGRCVPHVSNGPGVPTTSGSGITVRPAVNNNGPQTGIDQNNTRNGKRERFPTQKVIPKVPPVPGDVGINHHDGAGRAIPDGSQHAGKGNVFLEEKTILVKDGGGYDHFPENYHPPNGSGMIGVALGVGVVMSLTGVLVGVVIMKFRIRKLTSMDALLLTREKKSRRTTRKKSQTVSEALSKRKQMERAVSYVDVMEVREKIVQDQQQSATTKMIPQCSLPRIPEGTIESSDAKHSHERQNDLLELKEVSLLPKIFPPYAVVKKASKSSSNGTESDRHSKFSLTEVTRSNSSAYAKVEDFSDVVLGANLPVSTRNSYASEGDERETALATLYAKVNRNKNSNNEHKCRLSQSTISNRFVEEEEEEDSVYGRLDRPLSQSTGLLVDGNYLKYDRLKRGPQPRSFRRSTHFSELYESI